MHRSKHKENGISSQRLQTTFVDTFWKKKNALEAPDTPIPPTHSNTPHFEHPDVTHSAVTGRKNHLRTAIILALLPPPPLQTIPVVCLANDKNPRDPRRNTFITWLCCRRFFESFGRKRKTQLANHRFDCGMRRGISTSRCKMEWRFCQLEMQQQRK